MADKKKKEEKALTDIFENKRSFEVGGSKYYIDDPGVETIREADWQYSIAYNAALTAGVATMAQMEDTLEERGITGKGWEEKRANLASDVVALESELEAADDRDEKLRLADELEEARRKLIRHNQKQSNPMANCCEQLADNARIEFLTAAMIKDADGKPVWNDFEDYKTSRNPELVALSRFHVMLYLQGWEPDFMENTPEARARRSLLEAGDTTAEAEVEAEEEKPKKTKKSEKSE